MIIDMSRSYIQLKIGDKTIKIGGEAFIPGFGSPDFVVYAKLIKTWDPPHENEKIGEITKNEIIEILKSEAIEKGLKIEIE